jgi:signal transduction histidine kinase
MRERLESFGASFDIHSAPGVGTKLKAVVPLRVVTGIASGAAV